MKRKAATKKRGEKRFDAWFTEEYGPPPEFVHHELHAAECELHRQRALHEEWTKYHMRRNAARLAWDAK